MSQKAVQKLIQFLNDNNVQFKEFHHKPVRTSEEAQAERPEYTLSQGAKAIIIKVKLKNTIQTQPTKYQFCMFVLPGDLRIHGKKVRQILNAKSISFASAEEVVQITGGVQPGGVHPFGNLFNLPVYVDTKLSKNKEIIFNAGDRGVSIAILYEDYVKVANPTIKELSLE